MTRDQLVEELGKVTVALSKSENHNTKQYNPNAILGKQYQTLFDKAAGGIGRTRISDGKILFANQRMAEMFGYESADEFMDEYLFSDHYPKGIDREEKIAQYEKHPDKPHKLTYTKRDGSLIFVESELRVDRENGHTDFVIVDVTERHLIEESLRNSEALIKALIQHSPIALSVKNLDGCYEFISPAFKHYLSFPAEKVVGKCVSDLLEPDLVRLLEAADRKILSSKSPMKSSDAFPVEFGSSTLLITKFPILNAKNEVTAIATAGVDITDQMRGEEALRIAYEDLEYQVAIRTRELQQSETRFRHYAESSSDWYWEADADNRYTEITGQHLYSDQWQLENIIGKQRIEAASYQSDRENKNWAEHIADLEAHRPFKDFEYLMKGDGEDRWVRVSGKPRYSQEGEFLGYGGTGLDITQHKKSEGLLRRSQKMDAVGQLTAGIAHDFNNILGIIIGNLDLLKNQVSSDDKVLKRVTTINKSASRASELIKQLLSFSRLQATDVAACDLNLIIQDMDSLIKRSITPEIEVDKKLAENLWLTGINLGDYQDAVLNLILNARDAMPDGGNLTIGTCNSVLDAAFCAQHPNLVAGEYVQLSVIDTGIGMMVEELGKIYDPFYTTKPVGKGTGLGLSMVFGFVTRSNGYIDVHSELGTGTTFDLYLPRITEQILVDQIIDRQPVVLPRANETILAVDDEEELLELIKETLEGLGYRVLTATNANEALGLLAEHPSISLLFSDMVMPGGMTGFELAEQAMQIRSDLKVLLTSGHTQRAGDHVRDIYKLLMKPYSHEELAHQIRSLLSESVITDS